MKKITKILSFVIIMLLTAQTILLTPTVNSEVVDQPHYGDASAGSFWMTELDTTNTLNDVPCVGIAHAAATDDWVIWDDLKGDITADYIIDIDYPDHPGYEVIFFLSVYNVDDENNEIGSDIFQKTYNEGNTYSEMGTLSISLSFKKKIKKLGSITLVINLGAMVRILETNEAVNYTSFAQDRSIVAVQFKLEPKIPPFSVFVDEANEKFPPMFSWMSGWEDVFSSEEEMFAQTTFFSVGYNVYEPINENTDWKIQDFDFEFDYGGDHFDLTVTLNWPGKSISWGYDEDGWIKGLTYIPYEVNYPNHHPLNLGLWSRYNLFAKVGPNPLDIQLCAFTPLYHLTYWNMYPDNFDGSFEAGLKIHKNAANNYNEIPIFGYCWAFNIFTLDGWLFGGYNINVLDGNNNYQLPAEEEFFWLAQSVYSENQNIEFITDLIQVDETNSPSIVAVDITNLLQSNNTGEITYTFAGDRGQTRVIFDCT